MTLRALSMSLQVHCPPYHVQLDDDAVGRRCGCIATWSSPRAGPSRRAADQEHHFPRQPARMVHGGHAGLLFLKFVVRVPA